MTKRARSVIGGSQRSVVGVSLVALILVASCGGGTRGDLVGVSLDVKVSASDREVLADGIVTKAEQNTAARAGMGCVDDAGLIPRPTTEDDGRIVYGTEAKGRPDESRESLDRRATAATEGCGDEHDRTVTAVYQADAFYGREDRQALLRCLRDANLSLDAGASHADVVLAVADDGNRRECRECLRRYAVGELQK